MKKQNGEHSYRNKRQLKEQSGKHNCKRRRTDNNNCAGIPENIRINGRAEIPGNKKANDCTEIRGNKKTNNIIGYSENKRIRGRAGSPDDKKIINRRDRSTGKSRKTIIICFLALALSIILFFSITKKVSFAKNGREGETKMLQSVVYEITAEETVEAGENRTEADYVTGEYRSEYTGSDNYGDEYTASDKYDDEYTEPREDNDHKIKFDFTDISADANILDVPYINQNEEGLPTGCEAVSTVMALNYYGVDMTAAEFIYGYMDMNESSTYFNPYKEYGGDPASNNGMGCYAPVIENAVNRLIKKENLNLKCTRLEGVPLETIKEDYIDEGTPVIMWATIDMRPVYSGKEIQYNGLTHYWIAPEHCLLLVGYEPGAYFFNDPLEGSYICYAEETVREAYEGMLSQAVVIETN